MNDGKKYLLKVGAGATLVALLAAAILYGTLGASRRAAGQQAPPQTPPAERTPGSKPTPPQDRATPSIVSPADLAKELSSGSKPTIVCVAPSALYQGAHIPGALFHGATGTPEGLKDFRKWADGRSRSENIVVYCGCCPLSECPNIRPALMALRQMGFTHARVLRLETDFHTDWIDKGYPVEK
jgi:thiosulfate/3-mercaptopyruvate sulfurtransferase